MVSASQSPAAQSFSQDATVATSPSSLFPCSPAPSRTSTISVTSSGANDSAAGHTSEFPLDFGIGTGYVS